MGKKKKKSKKSKKRGQGGGGLEMREAPSLADFPQIEESKGDVELSEPGASVQHEYSFETEERRAY